MLMQVGHYTAWAALSAVESAANECTQSKAACAVQARMQIPDMRSDTGAPDHKPEPLVQPLAGLECETASNFGLCTLAP